MPSLERPNLASQAGYFLLLSGAAAAVFLSGGPPAGNLGVFLILAGAAFVGFPLRAKVDAALWAVVAILIVCAALALLPQTWISEPSWRQRLATLTVIPLGPAITVVPRETRFWLAALAVSAFVGLFCLGHPLRTKTQLALAVGAILVCTIYAILAVGVSQAGWSYPFDANAEFGFLPNKNHTATLLVTGSVLALGILGVAFRRRHWLAGTFAMFGLTVCVTTLIFFSPSRGGIVFLLVGTLLWLAGLGPAHRSKPLLISFASVFVGGVLMFLASRSLVRHRVLTLVGWEQEQTVALAAPTRPSQEPARPEVEVEVPLDGRLPIFRDALRIVGQFPFTGTGLGTFRYVFPNYRDRSLSEAVAQHPESDWLMLAAEAGLPALATLIAGMALLLRRVWPQRAHPYWPLRWGFICASLAGVAHGFIDVPAHRVALGWWLLMLGGIGFQIPSQEVKPAPPWQRLAFALLGLATLVLGVQLVRSEWFDARPFPPFAAQKALRDILKREERREWAEASEVARAAIKESPMADLLYFHLGVALLHFEDNDAEADSLFLAQRLLNPEWPQILINQGIVWLNIDPARTAARWLEAVRLRRQMERKQGNGNRGDLALYRELLARAASSPAVQRNLLAASMDGPEFMLVWLEQASPQLVASKIPHLLEDATFIPVLTGSDRGRFLQVWYLKGDREQLFSWLAARPEWEAAAWPIKLHRLRDAGQFAEAVQAAATHYGVSLQLPESDPAGSDLATVPPDRPAAAFSFFWRKGNLVTARRILEEARTGLSPPEPEVWRLSAAVCAHDGQWQAAWPHLERYLHDSHLDSSP